MSSLYNFEACGTFCGAFVFDDEESEEKTGLLQVDYFGGKMSVRTTPDVAEKLANKPIGCECRISGDVFVQGGKFKPVLSKISLQGDKDFERVNGEELFRGMIFQGPAVLSDKVHYTSRKGTGVYTVKCMLMGASVTLDVDPEGFDSLPVGRVQIYCRLLSEVSSKTVMGERKLSVTNWANILTAERLGEGRKRA